MCGTYQLGDLSFSGVVRITGRTITNLVENFSIALLKELSRLTYLGFIVGIDLIWQRALFSSDF